MSTKFFTIFALFLVASFAKGESGTGSNNNTEEQLNEEEACQDYSINWFIQQYSLKILNQPYLSIGVNVSLKEAAKTRSTEFKKLIKKAPMTKLNPKNACHESVPHHFQQFGQACSWNYTCDYNPHRFPAYMYHAQCTNSHWFQYTPSSFPTVRPRPCRMIYYPVPVLYSRGCNPLTTEKKWEWKQEMVSVGCA